MGLCTIPAARVPNPGCAAGPHGPLSRRTPSIESAFKNSTKFLQRYWPNFDVFAIWGSFESSLTAAIRANLTCNVNFPLVSSVDCNGISARSQHPLHLHAVFQMAPALATQSMAHPIPQGPASPENRSDRSSRRKAHVRLSRLLSWLPLSCSWSGVDSMSKCRILMGILHYIIWRLL